MNSMCISRFALFVATFVCCSQVVCLLADTPTPIFKDLSYLQGKRGAGNDMFRDVEGDVSVKLLRDWNDWEQATNRWQRHWEKMGRQYAGYGWMADYVATISPRVKSERVFDDQVVLFVCHQAFADRKVTIHDPARKGNRIIIDITDARHPNADPNPDYDIAHHHWLGISRKGVNSIQIRINGKETAVLKPQRPTK